MAITNVVCRERKGKATLTGGKRVRVYQEVFHVKSNVLNEDPVTVMAATGIPTLVPITTWPTDAGALLVDVDPQQQKDTPDFWIVTCSYTSNPDIRDPDELNENPLSRPAVINRNPQQRQRIVVRDVNGDLVVNKAGELFNPPTEREEHPPAFTITKNLLNWPYALELALTDAINSVPVVYISRGIAYGAGLMKCNGFSGTEAYENGFKFWPVSVALEVNWEGWNKPIENRGFREKFLADDSEYYMVPILGANGEAVTEAVMLDENGRADPFRTSPYELPYKKYREVAFADLFTLFGIT